MDYERAKDRARRREGLRLRPYHCPAGHMTIGAGWNLDAHRMPTPMEHYYRANRGITREMAEDLLDISLDVAIRNARALFKDFESLSDLRQEALVDVIFNMGASRVKKGFPGLVRAVNIGDFQLAADELKYVDGKKKGKLSAYWVQLSGDREDSRPSEIYDMLLSGDG